MSKIWLGKMLFILSLFVVTLTSFANDKAESLTVRLSGLWYDSAWVCAAAAGIFLLGLVVVLRIGTRRLDV